MTTGVAGYPGYVRITGTPDIKVKGTTSMDLPYSKSMDDTTAFDSDSPGWQTNIPVQKSMAPKLSGKRIPGDPGQEALITAWMNDTLVPALKCSPDGIKIHTFDCWVTDVDEKSDTKGAQTIDFTLRVEGAVVRS